MLSILNTKIHKENFEECIHVSCNCDTKNNCKYQKELDECNNDLLNIGSTCKLEMNNALKHSNDINLPFLNNSEKLQNQIDANKTNTIKCENEYKDLNDLNVYLTSINTNYKNMVSELDDQLSNIYDISSDACPE
jgi:hypothetical protein